MRLQLCGDGRGQQLMGIIVQVTAGKSAYKLRLSVLVFWQKEMQTWSGTQQVQRYSLDWQYASTWYIQSR